MKDETVQLKTVRTLGEAPEIEGIKLYYAHQYRRMAEVEDQAFKMSGGVFLLTSAVLSFFSSSGRSLSSGIFSWKFVILLICFANVAAVLYLWRVHAATIIHRKRAKEVLKAAWPALWEIDERIKLPLAGKVEVRPLLHLTLHIVLAAVSIGALCYSWRS